MTKGWKNESSRHSLSSHGIKTTTKSKIADWKESDEIFVFFRDSDEYGKLWNKWYDFDINEAVADDINDKYIIEQINLDETEISNCSIGVSLHSEVLGVRTLYDREFLNKKSYYMDNRVSASDNLKFYLDEILTESGMYNKNVLKKIRSGNFSKYDMLKIIDDLDAKMYDKVVTHGFAERYVQELKDSGFEVTKK